MNSKVLLGMSGGVDSSVSALLLKKLGYDVYGVTMKLWEGDDEVEGTCCSTSSARDAKRVCDKIDAPHYTLNFKDDFKKYVVSNFISEYGKCRTPNPCLECNRFLKFGIMYKKAKELGIDKIATGHYAKIEYSEVYKRYVLKKANNEKKDQSYFLYCIPKDLLAHILFPLGNFTSKEEVRMIARENNLLVASKPDSQDICFIPDGDYRKFLEKNICREIKSSNIAGLVVDKQGNVLGTHEGLYRYTIGQRKGIGISSSKPLYVIGYDINNNYLIVGEEEELYNDEAIVNEINLLLFDKIENSLRVKVKIRYSSKEEWASIEQIDKDRIRIKFENPVARITPGQSAVFYLDDIVVGGGKII